MAFHRREPKEEEAEDNEAEEADAISQSLPRTFHEIRLPYTHIFRC